MADFIDEMMGFNPSDMTVFNEPESSNFNANVYKTNPKNSKADDGHYRSRIRVIYNPFDIKRSIVKQATYAMTDQQGFFLVKSKLADGDKSCPLFTAWKKLHFSPDTTKFTVGDRQYTKKEWGDTMYDKSESQWVLVQILEDDNQPEMVGQFKVMKLPKAIFTKMTNKMNPSPESKKVPVPVMDYIFGLPLDMDVTPGPDDPAHPERKQREISYDLCEFDTDYAPIIQVDGTPLFNEAELETIDNYNTAKTDLAKAKTNAKKAEAQKVLEGSHEAVKALYKKAMAYLKEHSINLVEECAYQEWDEETTARVQNWINVVAQMKDPKEATVEAPAIAAEVVGATEVTPTPVADPFAEATQEGDDLPF